MKLHTIALMLLVACSSAGCLKMQNAETLPSMTPVANEESDEGPGRNPGSLYNAGNADFLFSDNRARRVGDIVMVNIVETSKAKSEANTDTERTSSMNIGVAHFFKNQSAGIDPIATGSTLGNASGPVGTDLLVDTSTSTKFKGKGKTDRKNDVKASIGSRVVKLLPGGLLQVEGAREVRVNDETQIMVIKGLVRPRDIGPDNSVDSTRLANSSIEYYGKGVLADKQKAGWVMRLLDNIWPF